MWQDDNVACCAKKQHYDDALSDCSQGAIDITHRPTTSVALGGVYRRVDFGKGLDMLVTGREHTQFMFGQRLRF